MATVKNTRAAKAPSVNPPSRFRRTPATPPDARTESPAAVLWDVRHKLELLMSVVYLASAALRHQSADGDADVALALRRCVGDELGRQIDRIDTTMGQQAGPG